MPSVGTFRTGASATGNTGKSLGDFVNSISLVVGAQDRPSEVGALEALHMAIDKLNEYNWEWSIRQSTATTAAGTADYAIASNTKSILDVRVTSGNERKIWPMRVDEYNRQVAFQSSNSMFTRYAFFKKGQGKLITFFPTPDAVESVSVNAYTDFTKPTDLTAVPTLPAFLERVLVLQAQVLVGAWWGLRSERVGQIAQLAEDALRGALMRDRDWHDEDVGITMETEWVSMWPWNHPLRSE